MSAEQAVAAYNAAFHRVNGYDPVVVINDGGASVLLGNHRTGMVAGGKPYPLKQLAMITDALTRLADKRVQS